MKYGLIGKSLGHSFSRTFFTEKFHTEHVEASYLNFELPQIEDLTNLLATHPDLKGFNVTIPYKKDVLRHLDVLNPVAEAVGAVNTVRIERNGNLQGFNTDVVGFRDSLHTFYEGPPGGKALILGTGGASMAVDYVLRHYFPFDEIWYASRTPREDNHLTYDQVRESGLQDYSLVVNCTPVGTAPNVEAAPDLPYHTLSQKNYLYDLIYNPESTQFMLRSHHEGAHVSNGMEMLVLQAEASWDIWQEGL